MDSIRECYEAFVILSFLAYLLSYLYAEYADFDRVMEAKPQVHHLFPVCCLPDWEMGRLVDGKKWEDVEFRSECLLIDPIPKIYKKIFTCLGDEAEF